MKKTGKFKNESISQGMCMGVAIGTAIGVAVNNISMGIALGLCIGVAMGAAIGSQKEKLVNKQISEKGYIVKEIISKDKNEYMVIVEDKAGKRKEIATPGGIIETELFEVGDVVYLDEDGMLEKIYDEDAQ